MKSLSFFLAALVLSLPVAAPAMAADVVAVTLSDDPAKATPTNDGIAMGGDMATANMKITVSAANVAHGPVTFNVTNASTGLVHEMLVVKLADTTTPLPYDAASQELNEDKLGSLGEVSELDPGKSGSLTLDLAPGTYALICNQAGHYMAGMWTLLTVS